MTEVRVERREFVEMKFGQLDVAHLVSDFAEEVEGVADLTRFRGQIETRAAEVPRALEILQPEVTEAEIDVGFGDMHRRCDERKRFLDQRDALLELIAQQSGGAEVFDRQPVQSIGAIALDPTNPKVVWVGSGESWTRNSVSIGDGIYKSVDSGETWTNIGSTLPPGTKFSSNPLLIDATTYLVNASGWGKGTGGVYRTTNGNIPCKKKS